MLGVKRIAARLFVIAIASLGCEIDQAAAESNLSWTRPASGLTYGAQPQATYAEAIDYNVFHSVAMPVDALPAFAETVLFAPAAQGDRAGTCTGLSCETRAGRRLAVATAVAAHLRPLMALRFINREVNQAIRYQADVGDHWASLSETAARGAGDCEDYAIAKWELLRAIGFAPERLQFIIVKDIRKQLYHAVLAVHLGGKRFILDNMSDVVAHDEIFRSYVPIISFVDGKRFIHGFAGASANAAILRQAASKTARPGEGSER